MLTKTGIEYLDFAWNFYPGCNHWQTGICPVGERCWAKGMSQRFKGSDFEPHLLPEKLLDPLNGKQGGRRIGVCFTGDLFGEWVDPEQKILKRIVFEVIKLCPHDTFIFLTKNPARLANWSPFPDNAWVGATVCNQKMMEEAVVKLSTIKANVKWISFEPLMEDVINYPNMWVPTFRLAGINWIVIGGWDRGKTQPQISWIKEIIEAADRTGIPVFLKDNLKPLVFQDKLWAEGMLNWAGELRQEYQCVSPDRR